MDYRNWPLSEEELVGGDSYINTGDYGVSYRNYEQSGTSVGPEAINDAYRFSFYALYKYLRTRCPIIGHLIYVYQRCLMSKIVTRFYLKIDIRTNIIIILYF